jgi:acetyl esterase/lipase
MRDIAYGPDKLQTFDAYQPREGNGAALLNIHGGGWWFGDKAEESNLATRLAKAGYLVFALNYRLADGETKQNLYPIAINDVSDAFDWLKASDYQFDRNRVAAIGGSSGGNLAVEISLRYGIPAVSWSGLLDLEGFIQRHQNLKPEKRLLSQITPSANIDQDGSDNAYYKWVTLNYLGGNERLLHEATPLYRVTSKTGPQFLIGSLREFVPAGELNSMQRALSEANVASQTMLLAGTRHAEAYIDDVWTATLDFLTRYLPQS